jgi:predicted O-linked N-acetylglucosamine transferase (SPINDLY family)
MKSEFLVQSGKVRIPGREDDSELADALDELDQLRSDEQAFCPRADVVAMGYRHKGETARAIAVYQYALRIYPDHSGILTNFSGILLSLGLRDDALHILLKVVDQDPECISAWDNLAEAAYRYGRLDEAEMFARHALEIDPGDFVAWNHLAGIYKDRGRLLEAVTYFQKGILASPGNPLIHSNLVFTSIYCGQGWMPDYTAETARNFDRVHARRFWREDWGHQNSPDPERPLRIGFVSPDLRRHAVAYFVEPLWQNLDRSQFHLVAYYNQAVRDSVTERIEALADEWRMVVGLSDDQLAEQIRADGIDILVDLAGHTAGNRLLAFARKPAPVQLTWLGYPSTTGLQAMDWLLTDAALDPPGMTEHLLVEKPWRMKDVFCVYRPHDGSPEPIDHLPADDNGYITFGCFNNFAKVTPQVIALWCRILKSLPTARLLLEANGLEDPSFASDVTGRFAEGGVEAHRLTLLGRRPEHQYTLYNRIDIALDPFPCNGGTTTFDTLWMGVPLIALEGGHMMARMGVDLLQHAGLSDLVATTQEEYAFKAVQLAEDLPRLRSIRDGLRDRVRESPLMNASLFSRNFEDAMRGMWRIWCEGRSK